jgi:hypothetical protein
VFVTMKARVQTDETGAYVEIPVVQTPAGVLEPLLDYILARSHDRSVEWMRQVCRSVRTFLEYLLVNPIERDTYHLFRNFSQRLYTGTFDRETGLDPCGLCWLPRAAVEAQNMIRYLNDFFDWLGESRPVAATLNPRYAGGVYDRLCDEAAYQARRDRAFLGHTWAAHPGPQAQGRMVRAQRPPRVDLGDPPAFPEERVVDLLNLGFVVGQRHVLRNMLITLLLHGAGFRESEPFHLYIGDVCPDPANPRQALVRIHHPSQGAAPLDWRDADGRPRRGNRAAYLAEQYGLAPRHQLYDSRAAGWKGGMHDGKYYKEARWFPSYYGEWFLTVWNHYLLEVARFDRNHPFAFVNLVREPRGGMYCQAQFSKAHAAACERIGLEVGKALGTTPHGHRHAYGRRLKNAGVDRTLIRRCMHHSSPESQEVYTQPRAREVREALAAAAQRLEAAANSSVVMQLPLLCGIDSASKESP